MTDELNKTLEEATRAREKVIQEANAGKNWVSRNPWKAFAAIVLLVMLAAFLAVKGYV